MKTGFVDFGGECGIIWFFLPKMNKEQIQDFCEKEHIAEHHGGPGMPFGSRPIVRHSTGHTLITQRVGLDV